MLKTMTGVYRSDRCPAHGISGLGGEFGGRVRRCSLRKRGTGLDRLMQAVQSQIAILMLKSIPRY